MHAEEQQQQSLWEVHPAPNEQVIAAATTALADGRTGAGSLQVAGVVSSLATPVGRTLLLLACMYMGFTRISEP